MQMCDLADNLLKVEEVFTCPTCGGHRLEEVLVGVVLYSVIDYVGASGGVEYGPENHEDGDIDRYQCVDCGWVMEGVTEEQELFAYLEEHKC
jgi:rubredoxin